MKVDENPFPVETNMVDIKLLKGKAKVLMSAKAKEARTVDLRVQMSAEEYREVKRRHDQQKSRYEQGETSRATKRKRLPTLARRRRV